jgi:hypothetical protein
MKGNSTLTRRFAPTSPSGRENRFEIVPLPLWEGGAKRRVRVDYMLALTFFYAI